MFIIQTIILGLCLGFVYALMATGLTLIFGVMRIVNLAHPIFILVGAFAAYYLFVIFGMDPNKIAFMSFSRKAATGAKDRAMGELNLNTDQMLYFRTLHSLAFTWMGLTTRQVFKGSDYNELGKLVGLEFRTNPTVGLEDGPLFQIGAGGDRYMSIIQMARVREVTLEQQFNDTWDHTLHWQ